MALETFSSKDMEAKKGYNLEGFHFAQVFPGKVRYLNNIWQWQIPFSFCFHKIYEFRFLGEKWQAENWFPLYNGVILLSYYSYDPLMGIFSPTPPPPSSPRAWGCYVIITHIPCAPCSGKVKISSRIRSVCFNCKYFLNANYKDAWFWPPGQNPAGDDNDDDYDDNNNKASIKTFKPSSPAITAGDLNLATVLLRNIFLATITYKRWQTSAFQRSSHTRYWKAEFLSWLLPRAWNVFAAFSNVSSSRSIVKNWLRTF